MSADVVGVAARVTDTTERSIVEVMVAVPARNEQDTIAACIASIDAAAARLAVSTHVVIAADSCDDDTARVASGVQMTYCTLSVLEGRWGGAGAARQAAVDHGLSASNIAWCEPWRVWIANTDADTVVPANWLTTQLRHSRTHDAVAGIVQLDPHHVSAELLHRFHATYLTQADGHDHVHGANLGVRAHTYLAAGGWCPRTAVGEDHGLWNRLRELGTPVRHCTDLTVITSGRTTSRVEGGFATNLRTLVLEQPDGHPADQRSSPSNDVPASEGDALGELVA